MYLKSWENICAPKIVGGLGFQQTKDINKAFLAKWGWQLLCGSNSFWASLVKAKYLTGRCFLDVDDKRADSWVWKGIVECKELLLRGACTNIGSGVAIDVWEDPLVPTLPNFSPLPLQPQLQQPGLLVRDLFLETGGWDVSKLRQSLKFPLLLRFLVLVGFGPWQQMGSSRFGQLTMLIRGSVS